MEAWVHTEVWRRLRFGVSQMLDRPGRTTAGVGTPAARCRPKGFRAALRWQIIALVGFAICFCTLAVAWSITEPSNLLQPVSETGPDPFTGSTSNGAESGPGGGAESGPGLQSADGGLKWQDVGGRPNSDGGTSGDGDPTPTSLVSVLTLVIAGVSGTGGFLSGVAALITVRQGARRGRRRQGGHSTHAWQVPGRHRLGRPRKHQRWRGVVMPARKLEIVCVNGLCTYTS